MGPLMCSGEEAQTRGSTRSPPSPISILLLSGTMDETQILASFEKLMDLHTPV